VRSKISFAEALVKTPQGIESLRHFTNKSRILSRGTFDVAQIFDFV
jgi:hypothetical protein